VDPDTGERFAVASFSVCEMIRKAGFRITTGSVSSMQAIHPPKKTEE